MRKMAILADGSFLPSFEGATRRFVGLARAMAGAGVDITIFHVYRGWSDKDLIKKEQIRTYLIPPERHYEDVTAIEALIRSQGIEILVVSEYVAMLTVASRLKHALPSLRIVFEIHDVISDFLRSMNAPCASVSIAKRAEQIAFEIADEIVCFNQFDAERVTELVREYAREDSPVASRSRARVANKKDIEVLPFGVEERSAICRAQKRSGREIAVFLGNIFHQPNALAVQSLSQQLREPPLLHRAPFEILVVGDAPQDLIASLEQPRLRFMGRVENLHEVFSDAAMALAPIFHGSGVKTKILDYAMAGLPILCSSLCLRGVVASAEDATAFLVEDEIRKYGRTINRCLGLTDLSSFGMRARKVVQRQTWSAIVGQTVSVYRKFCENPLEEWRAELGSVAVQFATDHALTPYFIKDNLNRRRFSSKSPNLEGVYCCGWGKIELVDAGN